MDLARALILLGLLIITAAGAWAYGPLALAAGGLGVIVYGALGVDVGGDA